MAKIERSPVPARIFHVDDHQPLRDQLRIWLELHGHEVPLSVDGVAAARTHIPDHLQSLGITVAVLDGSLGDGSGLDVAETIRESGLHIPIISFSGDEGVEWGDFNILKGENKMIAELLGVIASNPAALEALHSEGRFGARPITTPLFRREV